MELEEWTRALARELDLDTAVDVRRMLDVARVAAHSVDRPAAPLTTYLVGYAAGLRGGSPEVVAAASERANALAEQWAASRAAQPAPQPETEQPAAQPETEQPAVQSETEQPAVQP